jgi:excisionase family DNA binding protein
MPAVSTPNGDEFLRLLTGDPRASGTTSTRSDTVPTSDMRALEVLIRLVVRDELLRHRNGPSIDAAAAGETDAHSETVREPASSVDVSNVSGDDESDAEVMNANEVAAFLGVDRNTVYDYAGRGTIPCRRLGKRLLFHRPALVAWLDPSKAASTRKA